jgi:hypothetical protein
MLQVNLTGPEEERNDNMFKVVYNKKPLHGESRVVNVQKAANGLVCSVDSTGFIYVQAENRKVLSVGQIIL